jgi:hypothetical protein
MNRSTLCIAIHAVVFAAIVCGAIMAYAQQAPPQPTTSVSDALRDMQSKDLEKREASFEKLMTYVASEGSLAEFIDRHPDQAEPVKPGLIQLLVKEDGTFIPDDEQEPQPRYTENDTEYYTEVIDIVSSLNGALQLISHGAFLSPPN